MPAAVESKVFSNVIAPGDQAGVAEAVRAADEAREAIYPFGGGTAFDNGLPLPANARGLDLTCLSRVVDYTPRDMTIVIEAGVRVSELAATLAGEGQQLPIDVPRAAEATIGGLVASNWSGPRRLGYGTLRDYVIGIHAVDGRGVAFKGGGRVVKNVAGYDFCKLLTGSHGTLAVITQIALKLKPLPEQSAAIVATCPDLAAANGIVERLLSLAAVPVAIDLLSGPAWQAEAIPHREAESTTTVAVRVEGTAAEVGWLAEHVQYELWNGGGSDVHVLAPAESHTLWAHQTEFADRGACSTSDDAELALKISVPPSSLTALVAELQAAAPACTIQAHAASGIIVARYPRFDVAQVSSLLVGKLRPAAIAHGGSMVVLASKLDGLTPHIIWGGRTDAIALAERIKYQFDPHNILNRDRFVF